MAFWLKSLADMLLEFVESWRGIRRLVAPVGQQEEM
jgi:hypothetical protein